MRKKLLTLTTSVTLLLAALPSYATTDLPPTAKVDTGPVEEVCSAFTPPEWREAQTVDGVAIQESRLCNPDNPAEIAGRIP